VSHRPARHRKPARSAPARPGAGPRHRKSSPVVCALQNKPVQAAAAVAGSALIVSAWPAAAHLLPGASHPAGLEQADALSMGGAGPVTGRHARQPVSPRTSGGGPQTVSVAVARQPGRHRKPGQGTAPSAYRNPLRGVTGLVPERVDEGVDFTGAGPVYALGDAVITNASGSNWGWPGGGWITYRLTSGPAAGLMVYVAEDIQPAVQAGQRVTASTVIGTMFEGGDGIETGWAQPSGLSAESQLAVAGGIGGYGPFPTRVGLNFEELLQALGVPAAPNASGPGYGLLPAGYPASW
jgi:hypothetical protein